MIKLEENMDRMSNEADSVLGALKGAVEQTTALTGKVKGAVEKEHAVLKKELDHIIEAAKYIKTNWKKALPAIAAMGAGAYLLSIRSKGGVKKAKSTVKSTAKKAVKKTLKKVNKKK
jgi:uroporphyrinogen-III decarboxylase